MNDLTQLLNAMEQGDRQAAAALLPLVYDELRRLAEQKLSQERPGQTLQATALVHEAYLRLVGDEDEAKWDRRGHFFAAAAEAMRRILVEKARQRGSAKHGGGRQRQDVQEIEIGAPEPREDLLALDEALARLQVVDANAARLVHLRYFAGLSVPQAAQALGVSPRSADRLWAYAKAWLHRELRSGAD